MTLLKILVRQQVVKKLGGVKNVILFKRNLKVLKRKKGKIMSTQNQIYDRFTFVMLFFLLMLFLAVTVLAALREQEPLTVSEFKTESIEILRDDGIQNKGEVLQSMIERIETK
jgi:hypothetical protein